MKIHSVSVIEGDENMSNEYDRSMIIEMITEYVDALVSGDFSNVQFAPDVTLFTPFMENPTVGSNAVMGALAEISKGVDSIKIERFVIENEFACAVLEFKTKTGAIVHMCDTYHITEGKFAKLRPFFDPRPLLSN
jgi:hypothetical protein